VIVGVDWRFRETLPVFATEIFRSASSFENTIFTLRGAAI